VNEIDGRREVWIGSADRADDVNEVDADQRWLARRSLERTGVAGARVEYSGELYLVVGPPERSVTVAIESPDPQPRSCRACLAIVVSLRVTGSPLP